MIVVRDLGFTYPGAREPALRGLDFEVEDAEIFGFLGPNGAGKSTTQKILTGLLRGYTGSVQVLGRPLREWGSDLYESLGVGFELPVHYTRLSARENLAYFASLYETPARPIDELLDSVGLLEHADQRVGSFSKGMAVRLSFARAVLCRPALLFLDEPTTGLDPVNARRIKALIDAERARGATVFLSTHDMASADSLCDRVAFVVDGRIAEIDSPRALRVAHGRRSVRVECRGEGGLVARDFSFEGLARNAEFLASLDDPGLETLHSQETTLEEIFVQLTGRVLS